MKQATYSLNVHWDKRYPKSGTKDLCPIQLAVNLSGLQFKISLKLYATKTDWERAMQGKGGSVDIRELRKQMQDYMSKAETILERLPNPTRETFQRLFKSETDLFASQKTDITILWEEHIIQLNNEERIKTAISSRQSLRSLQKYKSKLYFEDINVAFLKSYSAWMINNGCSQTTVQIYTRNLRTIFNKAIKEGYISEKHYPFRNYSIGATAKSKGVLYAKQLKSVFEYEGNCMSEQRAVDLFVACFLCNGVNFKDLANFKWSNIKGDVITFTRQKTKRTNKTAGKEIRAYYHPLLRIIFNKWGNEKKDQDDYILPILTDEMSAAVKHSKVTNYQRRINMYLNRIGRKLRLPLPLNTNLARHSFATSLKINETPVAFISDAMGHTSTRTTDSYLKSIPDENLKSMSNSLLNFG